MKIIGGFDGNEKTFEGKRGQTGGLQGGDRDPESYPVTEPQVRLDRSVTPPSLELQQPSGLGPKRNGAERWPWVRRSKERRKAADENPGLKRIRELVFNEAA